MPIKSNIGSKLSRTERTNRPFSRSAADKCAPRILELATYLDKEHYIVGLLWVENDTKLASEQRVYECVKSTRIWIKKGCLQCPRFIRKIKSKNSMYDTIKEINLNINNQMNMVLKRGKNEKKLDI